MNLTKCCYHGIRKHIDIDKAIMKYLSGRISKHSKKIARDIANGYSAPSDGKTWQRIADSVIEYSNS